MTISASDVRHVAVLARLALNEERVPALVSELNGILAHMEVLQRVALPDVMDNDRGMPSLSLREDVAVPGVVDTERTAFAPMMRDGFFLVPQLDTHKPQLDVLPPKGKDLNRGRRTPTAVEGPQPQWKDPNRSGTTPTAVEGPQFVWLDRDVGAVVDAVNDGRCAPGDLVHAALARVTSRAAGRDGLNAVLSVDPEGAARDAEAVQARVVRGTPMPLAGVPILVKDNIATRRLPTSCGSRILEGYISPFDATVIRRLRDAGAMVVGKTNMDEFAMGSSTENSVFGPTRNPVDPTRVPGGSSGGSAAAVAAGVTAVALGSETGGSVRQPAAFCGIVGVKPTYGRVSRFGLVAFASSLDQVGVFGRRVNDAARVLEVIAGVDPLDATSVHAPPLTCRHAPDASLSGVVIGRPVEYFPGSLDPRIRALCDVSLERLRARGAEIRDVSLPHTALAIPVYYILAPAEASSNLARFDGVRYGLRLEGNGLQGMYEATRSGGFGPEVTRRILLGTYVLSAGYYDAYYRRAQAVRALITQDFERVFAAGVHVLFTPTTPTTAFPVGAVSDPYEMYLSDIFTATANLAGVPAMSQPIGRIDGLPVGGQLIAARFDESTMFRVATVLEDALGQDAHR